MEARLTHGALAQSLNPGGLKTPLQRNLQPWLMTLTVRLNPSSTEPEAAIRKLGNVDGVCRNGFCTRRFRVLTPSSLLASRLTLQRRRMAHSVCRFPAF